MDSIPQNIHPEFGRQLERGSKEKLLHQRGKVLWLYGLSGSGKSTLAHALERRLHEEGHLTTLLDGDNLRAGLNRNLGFSEEDRDENLRRSGEVAKLFAQSGVVVLCSFITPLRKFRERVCEIVGQEDFVEIFVKSSWETCAKRDVKGLYAKAQQGKIQQFTGKGAGSGSNFEEPEPGNQEVLILDTDQQDERESLSILYAHVKPLIMFA